jgi:hypothetical protein
VDFGTDTAPGGKGCSGDGGRAMGACWGRGGGGGAAAGGSGGGGGNGGGSATAGASGGDGGGSPTADGSGGDGGRAAAGGGPAARGNKQGMKAELGGSSKGKAGKRNEDDEEPFKWGRFPARAGARQGRRGKSDDEWRPGRAAAEAASSDIENESANSSA